MGTKNIECERLLTDADFKKIKKLKKRAAEEKLLAAKNDNAGPSIHMPSFDFMEERERLKKMAQEMNERDSDHEEAMEEADDEGDVLEEDEFEGMDEEGGDGEEGDEEDLEGMDEEELEGSDNIEFEDGDEEEDGEEEEEEDDDEEDTNVVVKGKKIEVKKKKNKRDLEEPEVNSSFYDDSESEEELNDPRAGFLSVNNIYDPERVKKRKNLQQIKQEKKENRDEHLKKKMGHKIKERGRLTNQQKKKNNPFQMFIQKKRLEGRLKDLKKANKHTQRKVQKGHTPRKLGKSFGRKVK